MRKGDIGAAECVRRRVYMRDYARVRVIVEILFVQKLYFFAFRTNFSFCIEK